MSTKFMFIIILFFLFVTVVNSSHFLGGTINWRIQNSTTGSTSVAILITQTYSWTYTTGRCDNSSIANNLPVSGAAGSLTCAPSCPAGFGSVSATPYCTDVSSLNGIAVGQRSNIVVISEGSDFSVVFASGAWGTLTLGGGSWSISSHINLVKRSDNGIFNNAPVATIMSPINIHRNQKTLITVAVSDADGDIVRCRWATVLNGIDECDSVCPPSVLPANTVIYSNCTIEIMDTVAGNRYAVALMVEDFINSSSTKPLSSVPVQFIVKIIVPPLCPTPPETMLTGPSCTPLKVNETFISQLLGINNCGENISIIDIATLSFSGMNQGPLKKLSSLIYYKTLTWIPTINQLGYQVMCAMALDSQYAQSLQYCFTFYVTENGTDTCPGVIDNATTTTPSSTTLVTTLESSSPSPSPSTAAIQIPTSNCISWPLFSSLAGLALLAMACNFCLLRHYCRYSRRQHSVHNHNSTKHFSPVKSRKNNPSTVVPIDPVYAIRNENINRSNAHRIRVDHIKEIDRNKVHAKNVSQPFQPIIKKIHSLSIETIDLSPKLKQIHTTDNNNLGQYNSVSTKYINTMNNKITTTDVSDPFKSHSNESFQKTKIIYQDSSTANVSIGYVLRPKQ